MPSGEHLGGTEGMGEAKEAFQSAMDAESPSRSKQAPPEEKKQQRMQMDDLFPSRKMDRREREGGEDAGDPEIVKKARADAKQESPARREGKQDFGEVEDHPPSEDDEPEDDEDDTSPQEDDEEGDQKSPEDDEDEEDDAESGLDLNQIVEVNIDGQPSEITLKEALRGYIRTETFHRRMGELQTGVQNLQAHEAAIADYRTEWVERAQALEAYVAEFFPKEPDWDALYNADPGKAALLERQWRSFGEKVAALGTRRQQAVQEAEHQRVQNLHNFAAVNRTKLAQSHPEWKSEKAWKRDHDSMRRTAKAAGYTDGEINQLYDARGVEVLLKAAKYDRMMATKPRPVNNGMGNPTRVNGATPRQRNVSRSFDRAEKRLSRTGSLSDAASVFESILDRER